MNSISIKAALLCAVFLGLLAGCGKSGSGLGGMETNTVIALVNGKPLLAGSGALVLRNQLRVYEQQNGSTMPDSQIEQERRRIIEALVIEDIVRQKLAVSTIIVSQTDVDAHIKDLVRVKYNNDFAAYTNGLAALGMNDLLLRAAVHDQLRMLAMMRAETPWPTNTAADARKFYDANSNDFAIPERIISRHIQLSCKAETPAATQTQLVERLSAIRQEIKKGLKFEDAAKRYSECPSSIKGGQLGPFTREQDDISELFSRAAFATPLSNVSDVVATEHGFHLIYVTGMEPASTARFNDVKSDLMTALDEKNKSLALDAWFRLLRRAAKVELK